MLGTVGMQRSLGFKHCSSWEVSIPNWSTHTQCLLCLGEEHVKEKCSLCCSFNKRMQISGDLWFRHLLEQVMRTAAALGPSCTQGTSMSEVLSDIPWTLFLSMKKEGSVFFSRMSPEKDTWDRPWSLRVWEAFLVLENGARMSLILTWDPGKRWVINPWYSSTALGRLQYYTNISSTICKTIIESGTNGCCFIASLFSTKNTGSL